MNKKIKTVLMLLGLVVLLFGGTKLYQYLSKMYRPDTLSIIGGEKDTTDKLDNKEKNNTTKPSKEETSDIEDNLKEDTNNSKENDSSKEDDNNTEPKIIPAPDFTIQDSDGNTLMFSDLYGKPLVLNFWATWCGYCKTEMPEFQKVYEELKDEVTFAIVNMTDKQETIEKASSYIESMGYTFPVYYDINQEAAYGYMVTSLPTSYFIDSFGNLVVAARGMIDEETLKKGIAIIKESEEKSEENSEEKSKESSEEKSKENLEEKSGEAIK